MRFWTGRYVGAVCATVLMAIGPGVAAAAGGGQPTDFRPALAPFLAPVDIGAVPSAIPATVRNFDPWTGQESTFEEAGALELVDVATFALSADSFDHADWVSATYGGDLYENPGVLTADADRQAVNNMLAGLAELDRNTSPAERAVYAGALARAGWISTNDGYLSDVPSEVAETYAPDAAADRFLASRLDTPPLTQLFSDPARAGCDNASVHCFAEDRGGDQFAGGATVVVAQTATPFCTMGPPYRSEIVVTFTDPSGEVYVGSIPGDIFNNANVMMILQCDGGVIRTSHLVYESGGFPEATDRQSRWIQTPDVLALVFDNSFVPTNMRIQTFNSDGSGQQGRVAVSGTTFPSDPPQAFDPFVLLGAPAGAVPPPDFADVANYGDPQVHERYYGADPAVVEEEATVEDSAGGEAASNAGETTDPATEPDAAVVDADTEPDSTVDEPVDQEALAVPAGDGSGSRTGSVVLVILGVAGLVVGTVYLTRRRTSVAGVGVGEPDVVIPPFDPSPVLTQTVDLPTYTQTMDLPPMDGGTIDDDGWSRDDGGV